MANTANLNIPKPQIGADDEAWGHKLNNGLDTIDACFKSDGTGTSVGLNVGSGKSLAVAGTLDALAGTVNVTDSLFSIKDNSDPTKVARWELSGISTGTTRIYTLPNASGTMAQTNAPTFDGPVSISTGALWIGYGSSQGSQKLQVNGGGLFNGTTTASKFHSQTVAVNGGAALATNTWYTVLSAANLPWGITHCYIDNNQVGHGMWCQIAKSSAGQAVIMQQASFVQPNSYSVMAQIDGSGNFQFKQSVNSAAIVNAYLTFTAGA